MRINTRTVLSVLAAGALLCAGGCGSKNEPGKTLIKPRAVVKIAPADTLSPNMVAAVTVTKGAASTVQVKFELGGRPQVGQPLDVDLVIVPVAILDRISGKVQGEDGLTVVRGAVIPVTDKPAPGAPIRHSLKVLPGRDGMFTLSAVIFADSGGQSLSQTFAIPVIVGSGLPEGAAAQPAAGAAPAEPAPTAAAQ